MTKRMTLYGALHIVRTVDLNSSLIKNKPSTSSYILVVAYKMIEGHSHVNPNSASSDLTSIQPSHAIKELVEGLILIILLLHLTAYFNIRSINNSSFAIMIC